MKKNFIAVCFLLCSAAVAQAKTTEITDPTAIPPAQTQAQVKSATTTTHQMSHDELQDFLAERIKHTVIENASDVSTSNMSTVLSTDALQRLKEEAKPEFQKIYEAAMSRVIERQVPKLEILPIDAQQREVQQEEWQKPNFPVIEAILPESDEATLIPAREHIPYMFAKIDVLPDGVVKIQDTITIVANGKDVRYHIHKNLPATLSLRDGGRQNLSYTFISATVNDQPIDYKILRGSGNFLLLPETNEELESGVYTYRFEYLVHNLVAIYPDFDEFYWDVTGSLWNLVIDKLGATITYPQAGDPLGQVLLVGAAGTLGAENGETIKMLASTYGYRSTRPLFIGEGFHIISSLPHGIIAGPSWSDWWFEKIEKYSDIVFSALALVMILCGFLVSKHYIRRNVGQIKWHLKKSAPLLRFLTIGRYDAKSFIAFLLEAYKKNIIDIQQSDDTILLVKRTDQIDSLSKCEQKAIFALFGAHDAVFNVNKNNLIKLKRAANFIEKELRLSLMSFRMKLSSGYILFSLGMLFVGEFFWALFSENLAGLRLLVPSTLVLVVACLLFNMQFARNIYNIMIKAVTTALILLTLVVMTAVISLVAAILIFVAIVVIFYFTANYARRDGLLKPYIDEVNQLKEHLAHQKDTLLIGREIANQQANIWALNLENEFIAGQPNEYNKLAPAMAILKKMM